ncbi:FAD-dependent monooxygenase [Parvibaculaceae bacterium PLY_AMNH_Bact1]|nr:FAD-dependent monooxygenase [Parvibaculaceae bacterium PLY_AMNH_Bact1]
MSEPTDILIAGAGIGGLTAGLACAQQGMKVAVIERASELGEVGAGLQIAANGTHVLEQLGLGRELENIGFRPEAATLRLGQLGRTIFSNPLGAVARERYGAWYYHVHRADLHRILAEAADADPNINLQLGKAVAGFVENAGSVSAALSDGTSVNAAALIGADGIHSSVREGLFGKDAPRFTGNVAWRLLVPTESLPSDLIPPHATVWTGPKGHAVTYYVRGGELVNFVGVIEREDWQVEGWLESGDISELKQDFAPWCSTIHQLIDAADATTCFKWALFDRDPLPSWSKGRVTLLGDACHPMLPFMAQGACMAIEDAWVLAAELRKTNDPAQAFLTYEELRKKRTARVQMAARANAKRFHKGDPVGQLATYGPMWLAAQVKPDVLNKPFDWIYGANVTQI